MVSGQLFSPTYCQIALFFSENYSLKFVGAAAKFMEKFDGFFSQEPLVNSFPSPMEVPPDFPRISLTEDGVGQLLISKVRADLYLLFNEKRHLTDVPNIVNLFASCFSVKDVMHFGLACVYDLSEKISISNVRSQYFCDDKISNAVDIQLGWTNEIPIDVCDIAKIRQSVQFYLSDSDEHRLIVDHNTKSCETCRFNCVEEIEILSKTVLQFLENDLYETLEWK